MANAVIDAERQFIVTAYYSQVKEAIIELYRTDSFENKERSKATLRELIRVFVTDANKVRTTVQQGLGSIAKKLAQLHRDTLRNNILYVAE